MIARKNRTQSSQGETGFSGREISPRESQSHCDRGDALSLIKCAGNQGGGGCILGRTIPRKSRVRSIKPKGLKGGGQDKARWPQVVSLVIFAFIGQP